MTKKFPKIAFLISDDLAAVSASKCDDLIRVERSILKRLDLD